MRLAYIKWADAHGSGGQWEALEDGECEYIVIRTVGWVTEETDEAINLIQSIARNPGDDDGFYNRLSVPKGMILEMKTIEGFEV